MSRDAETETHAASSANTHADDSASVVALCAATGSTTARIRSMLKRWSPADARARLINGDPCVRRAFTDDGCRIADTALNDWAVAVGRLSLTRIAEDLALRNENVWWSGSADHPPVPEGSDAGPEPDRSLIRRLLVDDDDHPPVLFWQGDLDALRRPRVAIVGTRNATAMGREMARALGRELSDRGVSVISGLALGIDAASHAGALASSNGRPVGGVGSGLGVAYPPANRGLWAQVAQRGLLISELPFDRGPTPSTFPARNRIIAQLAQVVVVVESATKGGSLITVDRALERGRPLLAVPGSPLSPVSAGTNELLRGGLLGPVALPCLGVADVLTLLDLEVVTDETYVDERPELSPADESLLQVLGWDELSIGAVAAKLGAAGQPNGLAEVSLGLTHLEAAGWVARVAGRWRRLGAQP